MDMSPRCLAARGMFSGQGGLVYTEMAPKCSCRAGDPCRRWASLPEQPLSDTLPSLGKVGASAALQRLLPLAAGRPIHGERRIPEVQARRWIQLQDAVDIEVDRRTPSPNDDWAVIVSLDKAAEVACGGR